MKICVIIITENPSKLENETFMTCLSFIKLLHEWITAWMNRKCLSLAHLKENISLIRISQLDLRLMSKYLIHCCLFQCFVLHSFLSWKFKFYIQLFVGKYIFNANLSITFKNNNLNVSIFDSFNAKLGGRNAHLEVAPCPIFIIPQKCI